MLRAALVLVLCAFAAGAPQRPGLQLRLSQSGLDMAGRVAIEQLAGNLRGQHISDQHGKDHVAGGKVDYDITNTVIRSFTKPRSVVTVTPGSGLTLSASGAGISVHGDWHYKYRWHFVKVSDHGSFDVSATGVAFSISVKMGVDKNGRPTIYTTACSSSIGKLKVKFHGGASWLYNIFDHQIEKSLKGKLQDVMCSAAKKAIDKDAEKKLAELKVVSKLGKDKQMVLDYRLTEAPIFGKGYIQSMHKGEISWKTNPKPFPAEPTPFPNVSKMPRMAYIWGSDYVINSYAYTAYTHGLVRYNLSRESMPKGDGDFLNTTCTKFGVICIGNFLYRVAKKYPNSSVLIDMETTQAPFIRICPAGINLTFMGEMTFRARTPDKKIVYLFKTALAVNMSVNVWLDDHTVRGNVTSFKPKVKVLDSKVGNISDVNMQMIFKLASKKFITKRLGELGQKGIDIPNIKDCTYTKPVLQLNKGSLMFAADIVWKPHSSEHKLEAKLPIRLNEI